MENLIERITIDPEVVHGKPAIRSTRILVSSILEYLAGGDSVEDVLTEFKELTKEDILACLAYASKAIDHKEFRVPAA
jgi:uncharacterized protein (DUF433 family)